MHTEFRWVVSTIEVSGHSQSSLGSGGTKEVENLLIADQRLGGPSSWISENRRCSMRFHLEVPAG
jgi:hypothetical protein